MGLDLLGREVPVCLSQERRQALVDLAIAEDFLIVDVDFTVSGALTHA